MPTFVDIAGGAKGDELKKQIEAGAYPGIVKTTLDGVNQLDYLEGKSDKSARDYLLLLFGQATRRRCATRTGRSTSRWCPRHRRALSRVRIPYQWAQVDNIKRDPFETSVGDRPKTTVRHGRRARRTGDRLRLRLEHAAHRPSLWLKELETYREFPPMQDPASYNLDQVMDQLKKATAHSEPVT